MTTAIQRCSGAGIYSGIYLSFDDGPDVNWTPRILDALAQAQMLATFFVVGKFAMAAPQLVRRIAAAGHAIGNHTFQHRHPWLATQHQVRQDLLDGAAAIADVLGAPVYLYRPPHGCVRRCMIEAAQRCAQYIVLWSLSARDWGALSSPASILTRLWRVQRGDIVLMHDGKNSFNHPESLLDVLPHFLSELQHRQHVCLPLQPDDFATHHGQQGLTC